MSVNRQASLKGLGARRRRRPEPRRAKLVPGHNDRAQSIKVPPGACLFYSLTPDWLEMQLQVFTEELQGW